MVKELVFPGHSDFISPPTPSDIESKLFDRVIISNETRKQDAERLTDTIIRMKNENQIPWALMHAANPLARGVALFPYGSDDLPEEVRRALDIMPMPELRPRPVLNTTDWILCASSEGRMQDGIASQATMKIGGLMIKFKGRITGLCFESFSTSAGTFIEGNFYSPDTVTQGYLKEQFVEGVVNPDLPAGNKWYLIRRVAENSDILDLARRRANKMPSVIPDNFGNYASSRKEYLEKARELYPGSG